VPQKGSAIRTVPGVEQRHCTRFGLREVGQEHDIQGLQQPNASSAPTPTWTSSACSLWAPSSFAPFAPTPSPSQGRTGILLRFQFSVQCQSPPLGLGGDPQGQQAPSPQEGEAEMFTKALARGRHRLGPAWETGRGSCAPEGTVLY